MAFKPKLLVLDIDGTIVNRSGNISQTDLLSLQEARQSGLKIALCTGRVVTAAANVFNKIALPGYHIFFDGALVCDQTGSEEIYCRPIPAEIVREACRLSASLAIEIDLYSSTQFYAVRRSWRTRMRREYFGLEAQIVDFTNIWQQYRLLKGTLIYSNPQEEATVRKYIAQMQNKLSFSWSTIPAYPGYHFVNMLDRGVSKGRAVEALAAYYQIGLNEVMAMGDGDNDISLLNCAGLAVAMQNAPAALKNEADYITADVEHNGLTQALRQFVL